MKTKVFAVCVVVFLFCGITHAGLSDGLVAYYPFNGNANDESGNGNNGIVHGATLTTDRSGNANSAYSFNGVSNFLQMGNSLLPKGSKSRTLSVWVLTDLIFNSENSVPTVLAYGSNSCDQQCAVRIFQNGNLFFNFWCEGDFSSTTKVPVNEWIHIVMIYDEYSALAKIYQNGVEVGSKNLTPNTVLSSNGLIVGRHNEFQSPTYWFFKGKIDDIRIYNRACSYSEIQELYKGQSGTCSKEVVKFTSGTPAKAADVNANFDALNCQIQALKAIVCKNEPTASVCQ
jgi:hypothetical protein